MKMHVISDLHTEHGVFEIPKMDADVLILAGDTVNAEGIDGLDGMLSHIDIPILMVSGNHEYYGGEMNEVNARLADCSVTFMENAVEVIGNVRFIGCNLWTDYLLNGVSGEVGAMNCASGSMNDFNYIRVGKNHLSPLDVKGMNKVSKAFLRKELMAPFGGRTVVITHVAPSRKSIHPAFENSPAMNASFACDCEKYMGAHVDVWIHGHTHSSFDYNCGDTRVVCNPRGYPGTFGQMGNYFNPELIVEVPDLPSQDAID